MEEQSNIEKKSVEQEKEVKLTEEEVVSNGETEEEVVKITEKVLEEKPGEQGKKKIMVAIEESEFSHYALDWALENLRDSILLSELIILAVQPVLPVAGLTSGYGSSVGAAPMEFIVLSQVKEKKFAELLLDRAEAICNQHGITAEIITEFGDPEHVICEKIEKLNIDMLIIGSHGRGPIQRAFLGSVSDYCAHHAKCPVLIVNKPHTEESKHT